MSEKKKRIEQDKKAKILFSLKNLPDLSPRYTDKIEKKPAFEEQPSTKPKHLLIGPLSDSDFQAKRKTESLRIKDRQIPIEPGYLEKPLNVVIKTKESIEKQSSRIKELEMQLEEARSKNKETGAENMKIKEENDRIRQFLEDNENTLAKLEKLIVRLETQLEEKNTYLQKLQTQYDNLVASLTAERREDATLAKPTTPDKEKTQDLENIKYKLSLLAEAEYKAKINLKTKIEDIDKRMREIEKDIKNICQNEH